ncbi:MAG: hypothetical protein P4M14_01960 [Gammaproteobacteria bacterium]|nr:hypothetical protein [Gammaproteobacteria bacterium]
MLEAIFDADFQSGSYGYRPKKTAAAAIEKVTAAATKNMTRMKARRWERWSKQWL